MSYYLCPSCDKRHEIFGRGGGRAAAERLQIPFLGEVPLLGAIRVGGDEGKPAMVDSDAGHFFSDISAGVVEALRQVAKEQQA